MNQPTCSWFSMPPIVTDCLDAVKVGACSESSMIVTNSSFMESSNFGEFYQEDNADLFSPQIDGGLGTYDLPNSSISNENWSEFPSTSDDPMTSPIPVQMMEFLEQPNLLTPVRPDPEACLASSETLHTPLYADLNGKMHFLLGSDDWLAFWA